MTKIAESAARNGAESCAWKVKTLPHATVFLRAATHRRLPFWESEPVAPGVSQLGRECAFDIELLVHVVSGAARGLVCTYKQLESL